MRNIAFLLGLVLFTFIGTANATSSNEMIKKCEAVINAKLADNGGLLLKQDFSTGHCWGAFDSLQDTSKLVFNDDKHPALFVCAPKEVTLTQYIRIFVRYAEDNPHLLHEEYTFVALEALREAFPCE